MKRVLSAMILVVGLCTILSPTCRVLPVWAYKSGANATHDFIFTQANQILKNDGWVSISDFLTSSDPADPNGRTYLEVMKAGSNDNDWGFPPLPVDSSSVNHYMDPTDHHRLEYLGIGYKSAGQLCEERFHEALHHWVVDENRHDAMYDLGWAAHLLQDICVPHHAYPTWQSGHSTYEGWVETNKPSFAVTSGGIYNFSSSPDSNYYSPTHYGGGPYVDAFDWVDYNAHESIKYFASVNYYNGQATDDYFVETVHSLPNNISTTWAVTVYQASQIRIHFSNIQMEENDYVRIYDQDDNLVASFTGNQSDVWTPLVFGNTLKIKTGTDGSVQSWGFRTDTVEFYDVGDDLEGATAALLSRAQRTTAGFIKFFFDKAQARPDIALLNLKASKTIVGQGYSIATDLTVENQGTDTQSCNITVHANTTTVSSQIVVLEGGDSATISILWNTTGFGIGNYTMSAYAEPLSGETDTVDNTITDGFVYVGTIGDVNGDRRVDMKDIGYVASYFGADPSKQRWDPNADTNGDNRIDMKDLATICKHFGEHYH